MNEEIGKPRENETGARKRRTLGGSLLLVILMPLIGVALSILLLTSVVIPKLGLGSMNRLVALGTHLESMGPHEPQVIFLGNSVTVEGIDGAIVEAETGGRFRAENLGINGCHVQEMLIIVPKLMARGSRIVVFTLQPVDLGEPQDVHIDKCFAYGFAGFPAAFGDSLTREYFVGLSEESWNALHAGRIESLIHFRTVPRNRLNDVMRERLRTDIRRVAPDEWNQPFEMEVTISGRRLERHLAETAETWRRRLDEPVRGGSAEIVKLLRLVEAREGTPVFSIAPLHPGLREEFTGALEELRALAREVESEGIAIVVDASMLLDETGFADALHMNSMGREMYSRMVARRIAETVTEGPGEH